MCRVQRRIQKGFDVFEYYACNQWDFSNANVVYLRTIMNEIECKRYSIEDKGMLLFCILLLFIDIYDSSNVLTFFFADIDMYEYFEDCIHAARLYILKETDDTIPAAKRHMKV